MKYWQHDEEETKIANAAIQNLETSSQELMQSCRDAVKACEEIINTVNHRRWWSRPKEAEISQSVAAHEEVLETLRKARITFDKSAVDILLEPHAHLFDQDGRLRLPEEGKERFAPLRGIYLALNFKERMLILSDSLYEMLEYVSKLESTRKKTRLWGPVGLHRFAHWAFSSSAPPNDEQSGYEELERQKNEKLEMDQKKYAEGKVQLERRPGKKRKARWLVKTLHWFTNTQGAWAFRTAIATFAFAIPAMLPNSVGFYYREKGEFCQPFIFSIALLLLG